MNVNITREELNRIAEPFLQWAFHVAGISSQVLRALALALVAFDSGSLADVVAGRDAVLSLYQWAFDGGFVEVAGVFYQLYEELCRVIAQTIL